MRWLHKNYVRVWTKGVIKRSLSHRNVQDNSSPKEKFDGSLGVMVIVSTPRWFLPKETVLRFFVAASWAHWTPLGWLVVSFVNQPVRSGDARLGFPAGTRIIGKLPSWLLEIHSSTPKDLGIPTRAMKIITHESSILVLLLVYWQFIPSHTCKHFYPNHCLHVVSDFNQHRQFVEIGCSTTDQIVIKHVVLGYSTGNCFVFVDVWLFGIGKQRMLFIAVHATHTVWVAAKNLARRNFWRLLVASSFVWNQSDCGSLTRTHVVKTAAEESASPHLITQ